MEEIKKILIEKYELDSEEVDTFLQEVQGEVKEKELFNAAVIAGGFGTIAYRLWKKWGKSKAIRDTRKLISPDEAKKLEVAYVTLHDKDESKDERMKALTFIKKVLLTLKKEKIKQK